MLTILLADKYIRIDNTKNFKSNFVNLQVVRYIVHFFTTFCRREVNLVENLRRKVGLGPTWLVSLVPRTLREFPFWISLPGFPNVDTVVHEECATAVAEVELTDQNDRKENVSLGGTQSRNLDDESDGIMFEEAMKKKRGRVWETDTVLDTIGLPLC